VTGLDSSAEADLAGETERRLSRGTVLLYIGLLLAVELATAWLSVEASLACYAALLLAFVMHAALVPGEGDALQPAMTRLALVAVLEVGAIALPQPSVSDVYSPALPAGLALVALLALRAAEGSWSFGHWPGRRGWLTQLGIAATGLPLAVGAAFVLADVRPNTPEPTFALAPANVLTVAAFTAIALEVVFRGALQPALERVFGWPGVALTSVLYAGLFADSGSAFVIVVALVSGAVWGVLAAVTGRTSGVAASHALFSLAWASLY
jgi:membrane protease YdiL (CAAX protease family)